jgi:hypothetical protein
MTRKETLTLLIRQAQAKGFPFRRWFEAKIDPDWNSFETAVDTLHRGHRYYALLFCHEFAQAFWKTGAQISFIVPASTYMRHDASGKIITVKRKAFTRRTLKPDVWRYHLREMAVAGEPLRYIQRFQVTHEELERHSIAGEEAS